MSNDRTLLKEQVQKEVFLFQVEVGKEVKPKLGLK